MFFLTDPVEPPLPLASFVRRLRPSRYYVTYDDRVLLSSEIGVLPDLNDNEVKVKARLEPGKVCGSVDALEVWQFVYPVVHPFTHSSGRPFDALLAYL